MKSALTVPTKQVAKTTASQGTPSSISAGSGKKKRLLLLNRDLWSRAVVLAVAVGLLYYLRVLVQTEGVEGLNHVYTVYACELLLLIGIGVLWRG